MQVPEAVVVLEVVVGMMLGNPRFQDDALVLLGVAGGKTMEPFGDLIVYQPVQTNQGVIGFRTLLKMEVGMISDLIAWILGILRIDENQCFFMKPDDSGSFWWIRNPLGFST